MKLLWFAVLAVLVALLGASLLYLGELYSDDATLSPVWMVIGLLLFSIGFSIYPNRQSDYADDVLKLLHVRVRRVLGPALVILMLLHIFGVILPDKLGAGSISLEFVFCAASWFTVAFQHQVYLNSWSGKPYNEYWFVTEMTYWFDENLPVRDFGLTFTTLSVLGFLASAFIASWIIS